MFQVGMQEHRSLVLTALHSQLTTDKKYSVLDLSAPTSQNITFFSQFRCKLHFADLAEQYLKLGPKQRHGAQLRELLPMTGEHKFDVIFAWDLLNYLTQDELAVVAELLTKHCNPGASFIMHLSSLSYIPAEPSRHRILGNDRIGCEVRSANSIACPKYTFRDISKFLPNWKSARAMHLTNSFQENLLTYNPPKTAIPERKTESISERRQRQLELRAAG